MMQLQGKLSVERMCQLAGVSRAGFYRHLVEVEPDQEEMELRDAIQRVYLEYRRNYGYRRITAELRHRGMNSKWEEFGSANVGKFDLTLLRGSASSRVG